MSNASVLFAGQAIGLVVPLLIIDCISRVAGPEGCGPVLAAQALRELADVLVPQLGVLGMAVASISAEVAVLGTLSIPTSDGRRDDRHSLRDLQRRAIHPGVS